MKLANFFLGIICCLTQLPACNSNAQHTDLNAYEFEKSISKANVQIMDVRTPEEYLSGHIKKIHFWLIGTMKQNLRKE